MRLAMHDDGKDRGGGLFDGSSGRCSCRRSVGGRQILSGASVLGGVSQGGSAGRPAEALLPVAWHCMGCASR